MANKGNVVLALLFVYIIACIIIAIPNVHASPDDWYVDGALGTDDGSHGTGPGANAFKMRARFEIQQEMLELN